MQICGSTDSIFGNNKEVIMNVIVNKLEFRVWATVGCIVFVNKCNIC